MTLNGIAAVGMTLVAMRIVLPPNMSLPGQCLGAKHVPLESLESLESLNSWSLESLESLNSWSLNSWSWGCFSVVRLHVVIAAAGKPLDSGVLASTVQSSKNMWSLESLEFEEHVVIAQWTFAMARSPIVDSRSVV